MEPLLTLEWRLTLYPYHRRVNFSGSNMAGGWMSREINYVGKCRPWPVLQEMWAIVRERMTDIIETFAEERGVAVYVKQVPYKGTWHVYPACDTDETVIDLPEIIHWRDIGRVHEEGLAVNARMVNQFPKRQWTERARISRLWSKKLEVHRYKRLRDLPSRRFPGLVTSFPTW